MLGRLLRVIWLIFALSLLILLLIMGGALALSQAHEIHGVEQYGVYNIQLLLDGLPFYSRPDMPPYNVVQYMPLYNGLLHQIAELLQIQPENIHGIYILGRVTSSVFAIGIGLLFWFAALRFGLDKNAALACLLLAILLPMPWFLALRPDSMMSFFDFLAFFLFMNYLNRKESSGFVLFGIGFLLAIAFFAKQTAVVVLGLILVFPFYKQMFKDRLLILGGWIFGMALLSLLLSQYFSWWPMENNPFYMNVIDGVRNKVNLLLANEKVYNIYFNRYLAFFLIPLVLSIFVGADFIREAAALGGNRFKALWQVLANSDQNFLFLIFAFWGMTFAGLIMGFKEGSAINYMLESILLAVLLIAYYLAKNPLPLAWLKKTEAQLALGLVVMSISLALATDFVMRNGAKVVEVPPAEEWQETISILESEFEAHPDSYFIYADRDIFERWMNLYFYRNVWFTSSEIYTQAFYNVDSLQRYLDDGTLRLFVTDKRRFPDVVLGYTNFDEYFELYRETATHLIYLNRNSEE